MENHNNFQKPEGKGLVKGFFQFFSKNNAANNTGVKSSTANLSLEKNNPGYFIILSFLTKLTLPLQIFTITEVNDCNSADP